MNSIELAEIKKTIIVTAVYYGRELSPEVVTLMAEDLADLSCAEVRQAFVKYRRDPKNRAMPLPAQIRDLIEPSVDDDTYARDTASRIIGALRNDGHTNRERAKKNMGQLGWAVVERLGGWQEICENVMESQIPHYQAQFRDLAKALLVQGRAGNLDKPPGLPQRISGNAIEMGDSEKRQFLGGMIKDLNEAIK